MDEKDSELEPQDTSQNQPTLSVATYLLELGYEPDRIKTERFGPTGG